MKIRVQVLRHDFNAFFIVRVRFRVINGYDIVYNMSTAVRIKLQTVK